MINLALRPTPKNVDDLVVLLSYLNTNFNRISDVFGSVQPVVGGIVEVTGTQDVVTGVNGVKAAFATIHDAPSSGALHIRAFPLGGISHDTIRIQVFNSSFGTSTTTVEVSWAAVGG